MKEFNLHFYSKKPCNIFINGELVGLIDNVQKFFIDMVVFSNTLVVTCEPISNSTETLIPISFKLTYENKKLTSSLPSAKIIPFPNSNFDVVLNFKKLMLNNKTSLFNKKLGSFNVLAMIDSISTISIFNNDNNLFTTQTDFLTNFEAEQINNLIVCTANTNSGTFMLIFNTTTSEALVCDEFMQIEKTENSIKALKNLNNTLKHGKVFDVDLKTSTVTNYNVYLEEFLSLSEQNLIPLSFLEAIKEEDFKIAMTYLDPKLNDVTEEKLKQYFDSIDEIYYNCYYLKQDVCNYTIISKNSTKNFNFYMVNNKIAEIEEVEF